jgi:hypothetical protein
MNRNTYRQEFPLHFSALPPLRDELFRIWAPDVLSTVHHVNAVDDQHTLGNEDLGFTVWPTAAWQSCVSLGSAEIYRYRGIESERFIDAVTQVRAIFKLRKRDRQWALIRSEILYDGIAELRISCGITRKRQKQPAKQGSGGVTASDQEVETLGAQFERVLIMLGEGFKKDIS